MVYTKSVRIFLYNNVRKPVSEDLHVSLVDFEILVKCTFCILEEDYIENRCYLSNVNLKLLILVSY